MSAYERLAAAVLVAHQRRNAGSCLCGWDELGRSHAEHVASVLEQAGALNVPPAFRLDKDDDTVSADDFEAAEQAAMAFAREKHELISERDVLRSEVEFQTDRAERAEAEGMRLREQRDQACAEVDRLEAEEARHYDAWKADQAAWKRDRDSRVQAEVNLVDAEARAQRYAEALEAIGFGRIPTEGWWHARALTPIDVPAAYARHVLGGEA